MVYVKKVGKGVSTLISIVGSILLVMWLMLVGTTSSGPKDGSSTGASFLTQIAHADITTICDGCHDNCSGPSGDSGSGSGADGDSGSCFVGSTPILMADMSTKPIEKIQIGDMVMSFDGLGDLVPQKVLELYIHKNHNSKIVKLNNINVTTEHRFLTNEGMSRVGELEESDVLIAANGDAISDWTISNDIDGDLRQTVYNFEVDNFHTYIAGGFRVHNPK